MSDEVISYKVDPGQVLQKAIQDALKQVKDLTIPLGLITKDWFQSNRAIFTLKGAGKYVDLTENYKKQKQKAVGFVYPILKRSGLLEDSITNPSSSSSIHVILNRQTLILGTSVPYAPYHQFGTKRLPIRPIIFTDGQQSSPNDQFNRSTGWSLILQAYVIQITGQIGKVRV